MTCKIGIIKSYHLSLIDWFSFISFKCLWLSFPCLFHDLSLLNSLNDLSLPLLALELPKSAPFACSYNSGMFSKPIPFKISNFSVLFVFVFCNNLNAKTSSANFLFLFSNALIKFWKLYPSSRSKLSKLSTLWKYQPAHHFHNVCLKIRKIISTSSVFKSLNGILSRTLSRICV